MSALTHTTRSGLMACARLRAMGVVVRAAHCHTGEIWITAAPPRGIRISDTGVQIMPHVHITPIRGSQ